jgi:hypothetical protein
MLCNIGPFFLSRRRRAGSLPPCASRIAATSDSTPTHRAIRNSGPILFPPSILPTGRKSVAICRSWTIVSALRRPHSTSSARSQGVFATRQAEAQCVRQVVDGVGGNAGQQQLVQRRGIGARAGRQQHPGRQNALTGQGKAQLARLFVMRRRIFLTHSSLRWPRQQESGFPPVRLRSEPALSAAEWGRPCRE